MANPSFTDENGANSYVWENWSNLPGDRPDIATPIRVRNAVLLHTRNGVVFARTILAQIGEWTIIWKNISQSMMASLKYFYGLNKIRFYPDSANGFYFPVYIDGPWNPRNQRGGTFNIEITLREI